MAAHSQTQVKHFERCHMPCPEHFNPADFFLVSWTLIMCLKMRRDRQ